MGMTTAQMRVMFREDLRFNDPTDVDGDPLTKASINRKLNNARNRRWMDLFIRFPDKLVKKSAEITYTAAAESIALVSPYVGRAVRTCIWKRGTDLDDQPELEPRDRDEMDQFWAVGDPLAYCLDLATQSLLIRPVPTSDQGLYLLYHPELAQLGDGTGGTITTPTETPGEFHELYVLDAMASYVKDTDPEMYAMLKADADDMFVSFCSYVRTMYPSNGYKEKGAGLVIR